VLETCGRARGSVGDRPQLGGVNARAERSGGFDKIRVSRPGCRGRLVKGDDEKLRKRTSFALDGHTHLAQRSGKDLAFRHARLLRESLCRLAGATRTRHRLDAGPLAEREAYTAARARREANTVTSADLAVFPGSPSTANCRQRVGFCGRMEKRGSMRILPSDKPWPHPQAR
jgi:hypothetical protein